MLNRSFRNARDALMAVRKEAVRNAMHPPPMGSMGNEGKEMAGTMLARMLTWPLALLATWLHPSAGLSVRAAKNEI